MINLFRLRQNAAMWGKFRSDREMVSLKARKEMVSVFFGNKEIALTANFAVFRMWKLQNADFKNDVCAGQLADFRIMKITRGGLF
jgi:hypothetical protein